MFSGPKLLVLILIIAAIFFFFFGAKKLPQVGKGMGEAIKNFKKSVKDDDVEDITPQASKKEAVENKKDEQA
ncbi:MAG: twin-arginine translocase TatA/TatE family subunit [Deferribacterales bacterium]|nr:twin-arginine translocase TatA/TatE family subunit [Deferribacterales bacterium]